MILEQIWRNLQHANGNLDNGDNSEHVQRITNQKPILKNDQSTNSESEQISKSSVSKVTSGLATPIESYLKERGRISNFLL